MRTDFLEGRGEGLERRGEVVRHCGRGQCESLFCTADATSDARLLATVVFYVLSKYGKHGGILS